VKKEGINAVKEKSNAVNPFLPACLFVCELRLHWLAHTIKYLITYSSTITRSS
jgi:hypothetical protein